MPSLILSDRRALPLKPLLHTYGASGLPSIAELHRLPGLGTRFAAILAASARFLDTDYLDRASDETLRDTLFRFYQATVSPALHVETIRRRVGFIRHALGHLLHGRDSAARKIDACVRANGTYRVPGLGPSFWSALVQGIAPARHPGWTPAIRAGLDRLKLLPLSAGASPATVYQTLADTHARIRAVQPEMTSLHIDHFLSLISFMPGRDLLAGASELGACQVEPILRQRRARAPLRHRLKERGQALADGQQLLALGLSTRDGKRLGDALACADPPGASRCTLDWGRHAEVLCDWISQVWHSDDPYPLVAAFAESDPVPGAGMWLLPAVLHLRDPQKYLPFNDAIRQGLASLDDGIDHADPPAERYRLSNESALWLREQHHLHPLELPDLLAALSQVEHESPPLPSSRQTRHPEAGFAGFCADTFVFLGELARENRRAWMDEARDRYHFSVRSPLTELCRALARQYIEPIVAGVHGWKLDTTSRTGRALTSVCKNVFGRALPYTSTLWITFCRQGQARDSVQLFVRLSPEGVRFGLRLGKSARHDRARLQANLDRHAETIFGLLNENGALSSCSFSLADLQPKEDIKDIDSLLLWTRGRTQEASCQIRPDDPLLTSEELVGRIVLTFDQLLPLFAVCVEDDPTAALTRLGGQVAASGYTEAEFRRQTYLPDDWLRRARELLALKKQLILQGVPGTGKTHIARCLARLLASGHEDAVRLVQFHPAYSYEEFVEGIRVRTVNVDGRHDITYPVEDGLLCAFAARAASRPAQPHVLIVDEINRGNLPRIFGELLYLLEYRGQAVELPYSRRDFHLPANLYLIATMNAADRSLALVDQALRRRFSFLQMEPDADVLASWLRAHPPEGGPALAARIVSLFDRLNARLQGEAGANARIGHSYFMVPGLDEARLRMIWQHHVRPLLDEVYAGQPGRAAAYDQLLETGKPRVGRSDPVPHS